MGHGGCAAHSSIAGQFLKSCATRGSLFASATESRSGKIATSEAQMAAKLSKEFSRGVSPLYMYRATLIAKRNPTKIVRIGKVAHWPVAAAQKYALIDGCKSRPWPNLPYRDNTNGMANPRIARPIRSEK